MPKNSAVGRGTHSSASAHRKEMCESLILQRLWFGRETHLCNTAVEKLGEETCVGKQCERICELVVVLEISWHSSG